MRRRGLFGRVPKPIRVIALVFLFVSGFGLPIVGFWHRTAQAQTHSEVGVIPVKPLVHAAPSVYRPYTTTPIDRARSFGGIFLLVGICWIFSRNRKAIDWRLVGIGLGMQGVLGVFLLKVKIGRDLFAAGNDAVDKLLDYTSEGTRFLFASYVTKKIEPALVNFAFGVLPTIVFLSSLMALLYYMGVMQWVIRGISWVMQRTMRTSGAETLSTAANIFIGQTEAPLLVRPFVGSMTQSEMFLIMAGGMANTSAGVLAAYAAMLKAFYPNIAGHLLLESLLSAPAAIVVCKVLWPEDGVPVTKGRTKLDVAKVDANVIEAAARGANEGLSLAFNVAAMLIAFIALVAMLNGILSATTGFLFHHPVTFQQAAGWLFTPFAWIMGAPWHDCGTIGNLLGTKTVLNEFVAYSSLSDMLAHHPGVISQRAMLIATYALCGFANFSSIGMQIGGIGGMAPERRGDIASLGLRAMIAGSFATFMTACFVGTMM